MIDTARPIIDTASLTLRALRLEDAERLLELSQEAGLRRWLPDQVYADIGGARKVVVHLIEQLGNPGDPRRGPWVLGVCLREGGALVGHVGLSPCPEGVEVGFAIAEELQGRGHATEAVRAFTRWGLEHFALDCIWGIAAVENVGSCRVLEKAGFELEAEEERALHGATRLVRRHALRPASDAAG